MATYATYRHIELDKVGCGKKRVLKPPGGGTSDIFSSNGQQQTEWAEPRRAFRNMQPSSKLFLSDDPANNAASVTPAKPGNDSYWRLFGAPPSGPAPSPSLRTKSNIVFGDGTNNADHTGLDSRWRCGGRSDANHFNNNLSHSGSSSSSMSARRNPLTGEGMQSTNYTSTRMCRRRPDGNPVTGEGYNNGVEEIKNNGVMNGGGSSSASTTSSEGSSTNGNSQGKMGGRPRVPPGGYSSGFW